MKPLDRIIFGVSCRDYYKLCIVYLITLKIPQMSLDRVAVYMNYFRIYSNEFEWI